MINKITSNNFNQNFGAGSSSEMSRKQKAGVLASAALGAAPVVAVLAKRKGFSLNPKKIYTSDFKDWALFKYSPKSKSIDYGNPWNIIAVASGSVAGGFIGGALIDDKTQLRAKKREVLNQILGNVLVPVGCVWAGSELFSKYENRLVQAMPKFKEVGKIKPFLNKCLSKVPQAVGTLTFLSIGIWCGNRVSNLINEKLYHKKVDRNIRPSDFAPHLDDICMATTMMDKSSDFGPKLGRLIPFALLVPGYETGTARE